MPADSLESQSSYWVQNLSHLQVYLIACQKQPINALTLRLVALNLIRCVCRQQSYYRASMVMKFIQQGRTMAYLNHGLHKQQGTKLSQKQAPKLSQKQATKLSQEQATKLSQEQANELSQELLATLALRQLAQEEEPSLSDLIKMNTVRHPRYSSQALSSWSADHSSSHIKSKEELKLPAPFRPPKTFKDRKTVRKVYEHTSTTLLQLSPSAEAVREIAKRQCAAKERVKTHSNWLTHMNDKIKLLPKRLKKERTVIRSQILPKSSFEDTVRGVQMPRSKNRQSMAIKKIKCEAFEKSQSKSQISLSVSALNASKLKLSLDAKAEQAQCGSAECIQARPRRQYRKKKLARTTYSSSMREVRKESIKPTRVYEGKNPETALVFSQEFKVLVSLLNKEKPSEAFKRHL